MNLKHKVFLLFLVMILLDLMVALGIDNFMRHAGTLVEEISEAGLKIDAARKVANGVLEENLLLLLYVGENRDRKRTGKLIRELHNNILHEIDTHWDDPEEGGILRERYMEYWKDVDLSLSEKGGLSQASEDLRRFFERDILTSAGDSEKTVQHIAGEELSRFELLRRSRGYQDRVYRFLKLPSAYIKAVDEFGGVFEQTFEYQKIWNEILNLQIEAYGYARWTDPQYLKKINYRIDHITNWFGEDSCKNDPIEDAPAYKAEQCQLLLDIRSWVRSYVSSLKKESFSGRDDRAAFFLTHYVNAKGFEERFYEQGRLEIEHVAENINLVTKSVLSLTGVYTFVFIFFAILAWGLAIYIGRVILTPVEQLKDGYTRVARGDFDHRINVIRYDELGELQDGFNRMAEGVEKREKALNQARKDMEELALKIQDYNKNLELEVARRTGELNSALEELKETDRIKSEFIANMSHELRTPLNSIIGFSKVILMGIDGPINEKQREDLSLIHQSGNHLLDLISRILDFSKMEAGQLTLEIDSVDLKELAEAALLTLRPLVKDHPVQVEMKIYPGVSRIDADRVRLLQVMINLLGNAAKFTERGSIALEIRNWKRGDADAPPEKVEFGNGVLISVRDTGIGIPEAARDKVFQKFQQVDGSSTRAYGGTGLGLTITRELVTLHGGHIWFKSITGEGSTFFVLMPQK